MSGGGTRGVLFAVQRFSVHDGPGIRTTAFLKGCPLACRWCQNPEGLARTRGVWHFANLCVGCGRCLSVCRRGALSSAAAGGMTVDMDRCLRCGDCVAACARNALAFDGFETDAAALAEELENDRVFFETSGGGVTFSGGEPYAQAEFMTDVATRLGERGVHVAVETSLMAEWRGIEASLDGVDLFIADLKTLDPERHRAATGSDNAAILENFRRLAARLAGTRRLLVRTPLIPGYTADEANLRALAGFIKRHAPGAMWELMNFNPLAAAKYRRLGRAAALFAAGAREYSSGEMRRFREWTDGVGTAAS